MEIGSWCLGPSKLEPLVFGKGTKSPRLYVPWRVTRVNVFICNKSLLKVVCFSWVRVKPQPALSL